MDEQDKAVLAALLAKYADKVRHLAALVGIDPVTAVTADSGSNGPPPGHN